MMQLMFAGSLKLGRLTQRQHHLRMQQVKADMPQQPMYRSVHSTSTVLLVGQHCSIGFAEHRLGVCAGFIVDKARGIICTNRHVVTPGMTCRRRHQELKHLMQANDDWHVALGSPPAPILILVTGWWPGGLVVALLVKPDSILARHSTLMKH
jgi:hypothetical protein